MLRLLPLLTLIVALPILSYAANDFENMRVRSAVVDAQKKLGELEPYQKRMFEDEVVPQAGFFVRNAQSTSSGLNVDVDVEAIRGFLSFYAPRTLGLDDPKKPAQVFVLLQTSEDCGKCKDASPEIRKQAVSTLEHRGIKAVFVGENELPPQLKDPKAQAKQLTAFAAEVARSKGAAGSLVIAWKPIEPEDLEGAHADEKQYRISLALDVPALGHAEGQSDIMDEDSFEKSSSRLMTEAWTRLGTGRGSATAVATARKDTQSEILIEVKGVKDYEHYLKIREALQARVSEKLGEAVVLEDRIVARGLLVVAAGSSKKPEETKVKLVDLKLADPEVQTGVSDL